jgi:cell division protein FtsB
MRACTPPPKPVVLRPTIGERVQSNIMYLILAALILVGVIIWRIVRLEAQAREQRRVIEELHQRVWQLEDLVAILHQKKESRSD